MGRKREILLAAVEALWKDLEVRHISSVRTKAAAQSPGSLFCLCLLLFSYLCFSCVCVKGKEKRQSCEHPFYLLLRPSVFSVCIQSPLSIAVWFRWLSPCTECQTDTVGNELPVPEGFKRSWLLVNWILNYKFAGSRKERSGNVSIHPCMTFKAKTLLHLLTPSGWFNRIVLLPR